MAKSGPHRQKLGEHSSFCAVCNVLLNSEFQTREHYTGRTHQYKMSLRGLTSDQCDASNSGNSSFCTVCNLALNSEFQTREHYTGRAHQYRMSMIGLTPDQPISSNSGVEPSAGPVKRPKTDSICPTDAKKPRLSASVSGAQGDDQLALLLEYRPGLEFAIKSQPGQSNDTVLTATVEIDEMKYEASAPGESLAKSSDASIVFENVGSRIEEVLAQRATETTEQSTSDVGMTEEPEKDGVDFTSLDDICSSTSFIRFSNNISKSNATNSSGDDLSGNSTSVGSNVSGGKGVIESGTTTGDSAVPGIGDAKALGAADLKLPSSSTEILNWLRIGVKRTLGRAPSWSNPSCEDYVSTIVIDGETFKGRAQTKDLAKAFSAEEALTKLFGLTFNKDKEGVPIFSGDTSELLKAKASAPAKYDAILEGHKTIALLNEIYHGKVAFHFFPPTTSQWGIEHRCSITVGGMTIEGQHSTKKGAKNRAALAAVAALKAGGTFARLLAESKARRVNLSNQQVLEKKVSDSAKQKPVAKKQQPLGPLNPTVRLNHLFPESKYESQGEVVSSNGKKVFTVAVKVEENVFFGTGSGHRLSRASAAENALRSLGLWRDEDEKSKKLLAILKSKAALLKRARTDASNATNYYFSQVPNGSSYRPSLHGGRTRGRGQAPRGQAWGCTIRGAGRVKRGLTRGIVTQVQRGGTMTQGQRRGTVTQGQRRGTVTQGQRWGTVTQGQRWGTVTQGQRGWTVTQGQRGGTVTQGQRGGTVTQRQRGGTVTQRQRGGTVTQGQWRASMTATQGMEGRDSGSILAIGGSYYDTSGSAFSADLGLGGPSTLLGTSSRVNFIGRSLRDSPDGNSGINANLLRMAHGSNDDVADADYDNTSDITATYDTTYNSSSNDPLSDPYATSALGFHGSPTDPTFYSVPLPTSGRAKVGRRPVRSGGRAISHMTPSFEHRPMSCTQISNEDGACYGVTTQAPLPAIFGTDFFQEFNYDDANAGVMEHAQGQNSNYYGY